ncbi:MAG: M23 family metallopeptidase, partial [Bacteroidales bacterium]|nr:M23 family metallopeptidase [Bacteroidales bacterium]
EGADIVAAADGTVLETGFDTVYGNYVMLWHAQSGQMTYYAHCKTVDVRKGQEVAQGEKIATVGQTGQATGSFLHFAVSRDNNWEEPYFLELE